MNTNGRNALCLLAVVWMLINSHAVAQRITKEYTHKKQTINKKRTHVFAGTDTLLITAYETPAHGQTQVATVAYGGEEMKIVAVPEQQLRYIQKGDMRRAATILTQEGKANYVVIENDQYVCIPKGKISWTYMLVGEEVMSGMLVKKEGKTVLQHVIKDAGFPDLYVFEIASAEVMLDKVRQKSSRTVLICGSVLLGILIRVATFSVNTPDVP
jgi:hypothetical protein